MNLFPFPHSLSIFFIFSPFSCILDARMKQVVQPWHQYRHLKRLNSHEKESTNQNHRLKSLNLKSSICRRDLPPDVFNLKFPFRISGFKIWFFLMHFVDNSYLLSTFTEKMFTNNQIRVWKVQFMCLKLKHSGPRIPCGACECYSISRDHNE